MAIKDSKKAYGDNFNSYNEFAVFKTIKGLCNF